MAQCFSSGRLRSLGPLGSLAQEFVDREFVPDCRLGAIEASFAQFEQAELKEHLHAPQRSRGIRVRRNTARVGLRGRAYEGRNERERG